MKPPKIIINKEITRDLDHYLGSPAKVKYLLKDNLDEHYEIEIHMPKDWDEEKFSSMIAKSFKVSNGYPVEIVVLEISELKESVSSKYKA